MMFGSYMACTVHVERCGYLLVYYLERCCILSELWYCFPLQDGGFHLGGKKRPESGRRCQLLITLNSAVLHSLADSLSSGHMGLNE